MHGHSGYAVLHDRKAAAKHFALLCVCVFVCVCVFACVRVCVRVGGEARGERERECMNRLDTPDMNATHSVLISCRQAQGNWRMWSDRVRVEREKEGGEEQKALLCSVHEYVFSFCWSGDRM